MKSSKIVKRTTIPIFLSLASSASSFAAITAFNQTFTNSNFGAAAPAGFSITAGLANLTLQRGNGNDLNDLGDAIGDGYLLIDSLDTMGVGSKSPNLRYDFGTISAGDIGQTVTVMLAYLEVLGGATIALDLNLAGNVVNTSSANTFGTNPNNGTLTTSYQVQAADVGKTFTSNFSYFDSSDGGRDMGIDQFVVTVVPEPSSAALLGLGTLALLLGRRRK